MRKDGLDRRGFLKVGLLGGSAALVPATAEAREYNGGGMAYGGRTFAELSGDQQDEVLTGLEKGDVELEGVSGTTFFDLFLQNTIEGFFGDPVHGGNRGMVAWKMIGFPGARYDYRPYVSRYNEKLDLEPVSVAGMTAASIPGGRG